MNNSFPIEDRITSLLDCINRPFDYHPDGRVPDGNPNSTIQLVDYYDDNGVYSPILNAAAIAPLTIDGLGVMYCFGRNDVRAQTYDTTTVTARGEQLYGPIYFFVGNNGNILSVNAQNEAGDNTHDGPFWSNDPVNLNQIAGSVTSYSYTDGIANALRVMSAGVRMWPTIELITNSDTVAISRYYGAQVTAASLANAFNDGTNVYSVLRNSPSYYEFSNSQGISGRFLSQQSGSVLQPLGLNSLAQIHNSAMDTSGLYYPVLIARLTQQQQIDPEDNLAFPVRSFFRTIMEGSLTQPTPLQATRVPYVSDWDDKVHHFLYRNDLYPSIVSGHSFKKVLKNVVDALGRSTGINKVLTEAKSTLQALKKTFNAGKASVQSVKKLTKSQKKNARRKLRRFLSVNLQPTEHDLVVTSENSRQDVSNQMKGILNSVLNNSLSPQETFMGANTTNN
jgi:hypothetical protein